MSLIKDFKLSFWPAAGTDLAFSAAFAGGEAAALSFEDNSRAGATAEMQATSNTHSRLPIIHLCDGLSLPLTELTRPNATRNRAITCFIQALGSGFERGLRTT